MVGNNESERVARCVQRHCLIEQAAFVIEIDNAESKNVFALLEIIGNIYVCNAFPVIRSVNLNLFPVDPEIHNIVSSHLNKALLRLFGKLKGIAEIAVVVERNRVILAVPYPEPRPVRANNNICGCCFKGKVVKAYRAFFRRQLNNSIGAGRNL